MLQQLKGVFMINQSNLVDELRRATAAYDKAEDDAGRLAAVLSALQAVICDLSTDRTILAEQLIRPLGAIEAALHDAGRGATVPLLTHPAARSGPPDFVTRDTAQADLAFAMELLVVAKFGTGEAAKWVANEARRAGLRSDAGEPITARQIQRWRADASSGSAPEGVVDTWAFLRRMPFHAAILNGPKAAEKRPAAEVRARALIEAAAAMTPRSPSKERHVATSKKKRG
jgi:hypothetical protein